MWATPDPPPNELPRENEARSSAAAPARTFSSATGVAYSSKSSKKAAVSGLLIEDAYTKIELGEGGDVLAVGAGADAGGRGR